MGFNFPNAPTVGQLHPTPAVAGVPQYQWNGSEWITPAYNPLNYVLKSGDTMLGALNVVTPPTQPAHAASKSYVDAYAAPLDALAYSGMQINGSFEVGQEMGTVGTTAGFFCDGWSQSRSGTMLTTGFIASVPGLISGLLNVGALQATTAQASLGAADYTVIIQHIEGYRVARLGWGTASAKPITIAFWSIHKPAGVYSVCVKNGDNTRTYATTYTHAVTDVPQYNVITVPGCIDGVWNTTNAKGISILFAQACGTTYVAPSVNTWLTGSYLAAPGQVNGVATTLNLIRFSGVVVLPGIYAPTAQQSPLIMRPYDQELATCQRYYQQVIPTIDVIGNTNALFIPIETYPNMRVQPAIIHPYTDGSYTTSGSPGVSQWNLQNPGAGSATKTGTVSFTAFAATPKRMGIVGYGATWSIPTTVIAAGTSLANIKLDARL